MQVILWHILEDILYVNTDSTGLEEIFHECLLGSFIHTYVVIHFIFVDFFSWVTCLLIKVGCSEVLIHILASVSQGSVWFMQLSVPLLYRHMLMVVNSSWWIVSFIPTMYPSFHIIWFHYLSCLEIATRHPIWFPFAWNTFCWPFPFSWYITVCRK